MAVETSARTFDDTLVALGFRSGRGRRGEVVWTLAVNPYLTIAVHPEGEHALVTWACELGDFIEARGLRLSVTDTSTAELYPQRDVRIAQDGAALEAEVRRILAQLRWDLGALDG